MLSEYQEQCLLIEYLELLQTQGKVQLFSALPNNLYTKSWSQKIKQKKEGLRPGFPDLVIVFDTTVLFLEMKRTKGGVLSVQQKEWQKALPGKQTVASVTKGFDEAKIVIDTLISSKS